MSALEELHNTILLLCMRISMSIHKSAKTKGRGSFECVCVF